MSEYHVSIGQIKREISQLVNRVAFGQERIVLTSRGKPKAVLVSLEDYERLQQMETQTQLTQWGSWLAANKALTAKILTERGDEPVDADAVLADERTNIEGRHDYLFDN